MENTGNYHLLSKFTRLRKKPQQPLTDLTELYGRIANESIYYLKLEEQEDYKAALQGWKALNTDVMYQLTLIDHEYPNSQSYSREETSIKSGVRELYHRSLMHLERVKKLYDEDQLKHPSLSPKPIGQVPSNYKNHASSQTSSFIKRPQVPHGLHSFSRKMATTLRHPADQTSKGTSYSFKSNYSNDSRSNSYQRYNKVNFVPSKPLVKQEAPAETHDDAFESFEENNIIIDLTQDSDEEDDGTCNDFPTDNAFDFDVEDFYGNYVTEDDASKEAARLGSLEQLGSIERQVTNLSMSSPPLIPELPAPIPVGRPSIPINQPPIATNKLSPSNIKEKSACLPRSAPALYKSNSSTVAPISTSGVKNMQKMKPSGKSNSGVNLKATKSTPNLPSRQKITPTGAPPGPKPSAKRQETATTAAQRVLGMTPDHTKRNSSKTNARQPLKKLLPQAGAKITQQQQPVVKRPVGVTSATKRKKKLQDNAATIPNNKPGRNNNGKSNSINSTTSASSSSSAASSSSFNGIKDRQNVSEPALPAIPAPAPPTLVSADEDTEAGSKDIKEELEDAIIDSLQGVDKTAAKQIFAEIVVHGDEVHWEDIAGLESAKSSLKEAVVYPFLRPDLFRGLREPVRGMLLFGPPGTGKTMLARAVATESHSTFFSISASSLTSKYLGESEKLVRALFAVAKKLSPSIIFVDEIDSIMGSRNNEGENESSRRIKNEFLIQWSSLSAAAAGSNTKNHEREEDDERVLVLAATNLPWSIDEAARRRFVRRQYIPLPEPETRSVQLKKLLSHQKHTLTDEDFIDLLKLTDGFSGSDITSLAKDAAMGPLRELGDKLLLTATESIRSMSLKDFKNSLNYIKPSVSQEGLEKYEDWALKFGSSGV